MCTIFLQDVRVPIKLDSGKLSNYKMADLIRPPPTPINYRLLKKMKAAGEIKVDYIHI